MSDARARRYEDMRAASDDLRKVRRECAHEWESGGWGVILGVSRCRRCGEMARAEFFQEAKP